MPSWSIRIFTLFAPVAASFPDCHETQGPVLIAAGLCDHPLHHRHDHTFHHDLPKRKHTLLFQAPPGIYCLVLIMR